MCVGPCGIGLCHSHYVGLKRDKARQIVIVVFSCSTVCETFDVLKVDA